MHTSIDVTKATISAIEVVTPDTGWKFIALGKYLLAEGSGVGLAMPITKGMGVILSETPHPL